MSAPCFAMRSSSALSTSPSRSGGPSSRPSPARSSGPTWPRAAFSLSLSLAAIAAVRRASRTNMGARSIMMHASFTRARSKLRRSDDARKPTLLLPVPRLGRHGFESRMEHQEGLPPRVSERRESSSRDASTCVRSCAPAHPDDARPPTENSTTRPQASDPGGFPTRPQRTTPIRAGFECRRAHWLGGARTRSHAARDPATPRPTALFA